MLIESNQSCSTQPALEAGRKIPQTLRQFHCQILQCRDTGCFFLYHCYTTTQLPLANTSNSPANIVQLLSVQREVNRELNYENVTVIEGFVQILDIDGSWRLSFTPHCNKPEPDVYTHTNTNVNTTGSHKYPVTSSQLAHNYNKAHSTKCP